MLEIFNNLDNKEKLSVICGLIVIVVIIYVLFAGFDREIPKNTYTVDSEKINSVMFKLGDNYMITIKESIGEVNHKYVYYYDGKLKLYEKENSDFGYLEYNNRVFEMNGNNRELKLYGGSVPFKNNPYYDFELIKNFTSGCDYQYLSRSSVTCKITLNDYLKYHNEKYGTSYLGTDNDYINLIVKYGNRISHLEIDYSSFNKIVNFSDEKVKVTFNFQYNMNDFDVIYDNYKDILEA